MDINIKNNNNNKNDDVEWFEPIISLKTIKSPNPEYLMFFLQGGAP